MGQITVATSDSEWQEVEDAAVRRRLQNRLAQRAHRQRHGRRDVKKKKLSENSSAEPRKKASTECQILQDSQEPQKQDSQGGKAVARRVPLTHSYNPIGNGSSLGNDVLNRSSDEQLLHSTNERPNTQSPFADTQYIIMPGLTTISALLQNAALLNIPCFPSRGVTIHIHPSLPTPRSLAPTVLQGEVPHWPLVDLLPFPLLRDKLLQAITLVNPADLWNDMANGGIRVWGPQPWEDMGWEVGEGFVRKWWFLMDDAVLRRANWWRGVRGEEPLDMGILALGVR